MSASRRSPLRRHRVARVIGVCGLLLIAIACNEDGSDRPGVSGVIPTDDTTAASGLPTTDGSALTTPPPNPNAAGAGANAP